MIQIGLILAKFNFEVLDKKYSLNIYRTTSPQTEQFYLLSQFVFV